MNLHCFKDNWVFRLSHILDKVAEISPDVIAFQEVCSDPHSYENQIHYIRNYLSEKGYPIKGLEAQYTHQAWDQYNEYIVLITKHEVMRTDKGNLPKSILQRGYVSFLIDNKWFTNTHLEYHSDHYYDRRAQIDFLANRYPFQAHLLMGDFNSSCVDSEQDILRRYSYKPFFPGMTQTGNDGNSSNEIDGFWISYPFYSQAKSMRAFSLLTEKVNDQYLSDHYAIMTQIQF
jgi:endonuclease/exonuclease/phosphatase family metal-dependent hydrolase